MASKLLVSFDQGVREICQYAAGKSRHDLICEAAYVFGKSVSDILPDDDLTFCSMKDFPQRLVKAAGPTPLLPFAEYQSRMAQRLTRH